MPFGFLHDDQKIEDPVRRRRYRVRRRADRQRRNLRRIEPGHAQPADGEEAVEEEEHQDGHDARAIARVRVRPRKHAHADCLAEGARQHELAPTTPLDQSNGDEGREEILRAAARGKQPAEEG